jgi:hypothetical protein
MCCSLVCVVRWSRFSFVAAINQSLRGVPSVSLHLLHSERILMVMRSTFYVVYHLFVSVESVEWLRTYGLLTPGGGAVAGLFEGPREFAELRSKASQRWLPSYSCCDKYNVNCFTEALGS